MAYVVMRELRHRLREYLARVEAGEWFQVTVFGRPVAEIRPVSADQSTVARLIAEGRIAPPLNADAANLPPRAAPTGGLTATDALLAERRGDVR